MLMTTGKRISVRAAMVAILMTLVVALGSAQTVKYQVDASATFATYKTYKWVDIPGGLHPDQITSNNIKAAFDSTLASKGFTKATGETSDLVVGYQVAVDQEKQINFYGGPGWRLGGMASASTSTINNGDLVFDAYDTKTQSLIWRGIATKAITPSNNPQKNQQMLQKVVTKLLQNFPPPPPKK
ncbi:MAG TPA: DUF4136 domain-containing protein [Blastocatellia bacterium]|nr:DUF4136 domain-containing protein [Blastocatellia bacterium]